MFGWRNRAFLSTGDIIFPDLRTAELGPWGSRGYSAAFIQLVGQEGVTSTRIVEISRWKSTLSFSSSAFLTRSSTL